MKVLESENSLGLGSFIYFGSCNSSWCHSLVKTLAPVLFNVFSKC